MLSGLLSGWLEPVKLVRERCTGAGINCAQRSARNKLIPVSADLSEVLLWRSSYVKGTFMLSSLNRPCKGLADALPWELDHEMMQEGLILCKVMQD